MGDFEKYVRSEQAAYSGTARPARTFVESVGQAAGEARRAREQQRHAAPAGDGAAGGGLSARSARVLLGGALLVLLTLLWSDTLRGLAYFAVGVVGLVGTGFVRRRLGALTPIYVGAVLGWLAGCIDLSFSSMRLNLYNLTTFVLVGGLAGAFVVPFAARRKRAE